MDRATKDPIDWGRFTELIDRSERILLTSHIRPDPDAIGSEIGMCRVLEALGKEVEIVNAQPTPANLLFLDPDGKIKVLGETISQEWIDGIDLLLVLDTTAWAQLGAMSEVVRGTKATCAVIDHHVGGDDLGAILFKNETAEAAGRLVGQAAHHLGVALTPEMAIPLFAAVATDTGWFRFASVSPTTFRFTAELMEAGALPDAIYQVLYEQESLGRLRLVGRTLCKSRTKLDGRLIHTEITLADFQQAGADSSDSEDIVNMTLTVDGTELAFILVEQKGGGFKISFRSRCEVDCSQVAKKFNGGGHKKAAGAFVEASLEETRKKVMEEMINAWQAKYGATA
jgi:phosphoesterase RecJ-like protein